MKEPVFVYHVPLPDGVHEIVLPCPDGHTIYIDNRLNFEESLKAYHHALHHIEQNDFEKSDVQEVEHAAHKKER